jgi:hypothetical protein
MNNLKTYLAIKEFNQEDSREVILHKIKDLFDTGYNFSNLKKKEENNLSLKDALTYNSTIEEVFYKNTEEDLALSQIPELINIIGNDITKLNTEEYINFEIVSIDRSDVVTVAISINKK